VLKNVPFLSFVRLKNAPLVLKNAPFACSKMPLFIFYLFSGVLAFLLATLLRAPKIQKEIIGTMADTNSPTL
jgi:hypothetical protein